MNFREWLSNNEEAFRQFVHEMRNQMGQKAWREAKSLGLSISLGRNVPRISRHAMGWTREFDKDLSQITIHFDGKDYSFMFDLENAKLAAHFINHLMSKLVKN